MNRVSTEPMFTKKFKQINSFNIAYLDEGQGKVIFCITSWPTSSYTFQKFIELAKDQYRIIAFDLSYYGGDTTSDSETLLKFEDYSNLISEFIKSFEINEYSIIAYSMGGLMLQDILKRELLNPEKIIFISSMTNGKQYHSNNKIRLNYINFIKNIFFLPNKFKVKIILLTTTLSAITSALSYKNSNDKKGIRKIIWSNHRINFDKALSLLQNVSNISFQNKLKKIPETLVIYADHDKDYVKAQNEELVNLFSAQKFIVKNSDHNHFAFEPETSIEVVKKFIG